MRIEGKDRQDALGGLSLRKAIGICGSRASDPNNRCRCDGGSPIVSSTARGACVPIMISFVISLSLTPFASRTCIRAYLTFVSSHVRSTAVTCATTSCNYRWALRLSERTTAAVDFTLRPVYTRRLWFASLDKFIRKKCSFYSENIWFEK